MTSYLVQSFMASKFLWLLKFHSGCHGANLPYQQDFWLVPIVSGNLGTKYKLNMILNKELINVSVWFPWELSYHISKV